MAAAVESWDDDADFQGDLFTNSVSTVQTSLSSRISINSESNVGDDDWQVQLTPNDDNSTSNAIQAAKQKGIPIPTDVPASALMGGTIKRLGKKTSRQKIKDDWGDDLELPGEGLSLKKPQPQPSQLPTPKDEDDDFDFDDFTDGSLGIRFGGTRRETRNRSSSASAMSPSMGSATIEESEEDDMIGLELPTGPLNFKAILEKKATTEFPVDLEPEKKDIPIEQPAAKTTTKSALLNEEDDFFADLDIGGGNVFDPKKLTLHRNIKQKTAKPSPTPASRAPATTLTFTDKPAATRIPQPVTRSKPTSRLEPVLESGTAQPTRSRPQPTTTGAQLLRSKRSMPVLSRNRFDNPPKPPVPFLPAGASSGQSKHITSKPSAYHLRRESDPNRAQSPPPRSYSRLSTAYVPDTPSRTSRRNESTASALAREAAIKRAVTKPARRRNFGDGTELEIFDDLRSDPKQEAKFMKQPSARGPPRTLRPIPSRLDVRDSAGSKLPIPDRMATPMPGGPMTPRSPMKVFQEQSNTPRYLRDTAASRIARESRLANGPNPRPRSEGPLMPMTTNWKAQVAARSPHTSPSAQRTKGKRSAPQLIKALGGAHIPKSEKGMVYNPVTLRWEGNENSLTPFDLPPPLQTPTLFSHNNNNNNNNNNFLSHQHHNPAPPPSPPRPALIAPLSTAPTGVQVVGGMVFDPQKMCWLKYKPTDRAENPLSPSATDADDDEDPFAGLEDLKDSPAVPASGTATSTTGAAGGAAAADEWLVGEEFDLGPEFIRRQREEEVAWRRKCDGWFDLEGFGRQGEAWRWAIRDIAGRMTPRLS